MSKKSRASEPYYRDQRATPTPDTIRMISSLNLDHSAWSINAEDLNYPIISLSTYAQPWLSRQYSNELINSCKLRSLLTEKFTILLIFLSRRTNRTKLSSFLELFHAFFFNSSFVDIFSIPGTTKTTENTLINPLYTSYTIEILTILISSIEFSRSGIIAGSPSFLHISARSFSRIDSRDD